MFDVAMFDVADTFIVTQALSLIGLHFKVTCVHPNIFPRTLPMNVVVVEDKEIMLPFLPLTRFRTLRPFCPNGNL